MRAMRSCASVEMWSQYGEWNSYWGREGVRGWSGRPRGVEEPEVDEKAEPGRVAVKRAGRRR